MLTHAAVKILAAIVFISALSARGVDAATTASVTPSADAFVAASNPGNNYGAAGALSLAAAGLANGEFQSVLRFDTSPAKATFDAQYGPGNWSIQSVGLRLTAAAPNNAIYNASAAGTFAASWMQNDSWVEGTGMPAAPTTTGITFNTLPSFLGPNDALLGGFAFAGGTSGSASYSLGLPASFVNDLLGGSLVSMRLYASDSAVSYLFNSRNFGTASSRPEFSITVVPEPMVGGPLLAGWLVLRRRATRVPRSA